MTLDKTEDLEPIDGDDDPGEPDAIMAALLAEQEADAAAEGDPELPEGEAPTVEQDLREQVEEIEEEERVQEVHGEAPAHWSREDKALLAKIKNKDDRQAWINWRKSIEAGLTPKLQEAASVRKDIEAIDAALQPFAPHMQASGLSRAQAVQSVLSAWSTIKDNPAQGLVWATQAFGRSLAGSEQAKEVVRQISAALGVGSAQGQANNPMAAKVEALEREIWGFKQGAQEAQQRLHQEVVQSAETKLKEFTDAKDASGQLKHKHFDAVRGTMSAIVQASAASGEKIDLETAYERALWTRKDLRGELMNGTPKAKAQAGQEHVARARNAMTPRGRSVTTAKADEESDGREPAAIMRELLSEGAGARH